MAISTLKAGDKITSLGRIGQKRAELYKKLGVETVGELLKLFPRGYIDYSSPTPISEAVPDEMNVIAATVTRKLMPARIRKGMTIYKLVATDGRHDMTVTIYNSQYLFDRLVVGEEYLFYGKLSLSGKKADMQSPLVLQGDSEELIQPIYPLTEGLSQAMLRLSVREALTKTDDISETLPKDVIRKNELCAVRYAYENIHFPKDNHALLVARERLIFEELFMLSLGMQVLKQRGKQQSSVTIKNTSAEPFFESLPFELTNAQKRSVNECIADMTKGVQMNRLLQGDVGSGKTVVAAACAYIAAQNGMQTALMAPTEILAIQHYKTLSGFLNPLGIKVCLLTGSMTQKEKNEIRSLMENGECNVAVGTHALFQDSVSFENLGLVITDEQHRFGVNQRARLSAKGKSPHRLVMSATPIPRTLALMVFGDLDISLLDELPKGRSQIKTWGVSGKKREGAFGFVASQLDEGRQAYIVCPMIEDSDSDLKSVVKYAQTVSETAFKKYRVGLLHGKLPSDEKDRIMQAFKNHELDLLVATTVVEVGVDVPNATVMIIENAERFGLSQLHQLRGRVGRGKWQSYCIMISDSMSEECRHRMEIMTKTTDGFKISEEDLRLRGPGEFFGSRQHGLPRMKIADMAQDFEVMKRAQRAASELVADDPELSKPCNKSLLAGVRELFDKGSDL